MKISLATLALTRMISSATAVVAGNDFFVPLPEPVLFSDTFTKIHYGTPSAPVHTLLSVTVSTDDTLVFWDHWEDGYEDDSTFHVQASTEVWGDGDYTNGCRPKADLVDRECSDNSHDLPFKAGDSVIMKETVTLPRDENVIKYDGGDHIRGTYPLAVVRGAFPDSPGSLLAGAVEVLEKRYWGTSYEMPVETNDSLGANNAAFEYCSAFIMASEDGTTLTLPGGSTVTMNKGESQTYPIIGKGDVFISDKPVQVHLLTGDVNSDYELRWFTLLPREDWSNEFLTPVGTTKGEAKVVIYNPITNPSSTFKVKYYSTDGTERVQSITLDPGTNCESTIIPNGSGAYVYQEQGRSFVALSMVDTENGGQIYDWGSPIPSLRQLTSQVLVGLGFGCTHNDCDSRGVRSVVWISPVEDARVYVDLNNDGVISGNDQTHSVEQFRSLKVYDPVSEDLSGALIYATKIDSDDPVPISVVWGQDPDLAVVNDYDALDLGTLIAPFDPVQVSESVKNLIDNDGDGFVSPGDVVQWTITIQNTGQVDIGANDLKIVGCSIDDQTVYRPTTTTWEVVNPNNPSEADSISDVGTTDYPLDEEGFVIPRTLNKRGGSFHIMFEATVKDRDSIRDPPLMLNDCGLLHQPNKDPLPQALPYDAKTPVVLPSLPTCSVDMTISGEDKLPWGGAPEQYQCGVNISYNVVPATKTMTLMGYNPSGEDEVLGEVSIAADMLSGEQNGLGIVKEMPLSCNNQGKILGMNGPTGIVGQPLQVYVKGPCGASPKIPVECDTAPSTTSPTVAPTSPPPLPPPEDQSSGSCMSILTLNGPESIHEGSNRGFHCTGTMSYEQVPITKDLKLFAVNPNGEDELVGHSSVANALLTGPQSGLALDHVFPLYCDGNNLAGPEGHSTLGANGAEVELYVLGPCGQSNKVPTVCRNDGGGGANGDPHIKAWRNQHFDYNGACDLVLIHSPKFHNGLGLDVHIRTKIRRNMSYISSAAVRIGTDILEVSSKGIYSLNGQLRAFMPATLSEFSVSYELDDSNRHVFEVILGGHQRLWVKVFKDFVSVLVDSATPQDFGESLGLMGDFDTGMFTARDGVTILEDMNQFGQEWQVTDKEPKLFVDKERFPQYPVECKLPSETADHRRRRLAEDNGQLLAAAMNACAHWGEGDAQDDCIFDVLTTEDVEMAAGGSY